MLEGLPVTGKTTNSAFIRMQLERNGKKVKWFHEVARPHPTLFFDESCLTRDEYERLLLTCPHAASALHSIAMFRKNTVGLDLLEAEWNYLSVIGDAAFQALKQYDVWSFPHDGYIEAALDKWADFTEKALLEPDMVYILDSSIFQYQIFRFLLNGAPYEELERFIHRLIDIVKRLNPSLIYFFRDNPEDTINHLEKDRGREFLEYIWERDKEAPYYQDKPKGAKGHIQFLRDYAHAAKMLFEAIDCIKLAVEISKADWPRYESEMLNFIGIKRIPSENIFPPNGVFKNAQLNLEIVVDGLTIKDPTGKLRALTPKTDGEFYVECLPVVLHFEKQDSLIISGLQICERWTTAGMAYERCPL